MNPDLKTNKTLLVANESENALLLECLPTPAAFLTALLAMLAKRKAPARISFIGHLRILRLRGKLLWSIRALSRLRESHSASHRLDEMQDILDTPKNLREILAVYGYGGASIAVEFKPHDHEKIVSWIRQASAILGVDIVNTLAEEATRQ